MIALFSNIKRHIALKQMADFFEKVERSPIERTPADAGLVYKEISFQAPDGVNLKGWYIPSANGDKLVVFNHFLVGNRSGAKPNKDWGNVAVDFIPIYRHLIDAGYSVFTYNYFARNPREMIEWLDTH